jgi:hypothetical protein
VSLRPDVPYWIAFSLLPGIGAQRLRRLAEAFRDMELAWQAPVADLVAAGLEPKVAHAAVEARRSIDVEAALARIARVGVTVHTLADPTYPARLAEIYDAPPVLYVQGELALQDEWAVAVVGTRNVSPYGREATYRLVTDLARRNVTIVSGLARGVDGMAHRAALEAGEPWPSSPAASTSSIRRSTGAWPPRSRSAAPSSPSIPSARRPKPEISQPATGSSAVSPWAPSSWRPARRAARSSPRSALWSRTATSSPSRAASSPAAPSAPTG